MIRQLVETITGGHRSPIDRDALMDAKADTLPLDAGKPADLATASFAMGCFWGPDAIFGAVDGVYRTRVGYAGGESSDPSYHDLDGHTETIQIDFDPSTVSYQDLLELFWNSHRPSVEQKTQYRSILFIHTDEQHTAAEESLQAMKDDSEAEILTDIKKIDRFYPAELYHQKYHLREYGTVLKELQSVYSDLAIVNSTVAARLNGVAAGQVGGKQLEREVGQYGLSDEVISVLEDMAE